MIIKQAMMKMSKTVDGVQGSTNKLVLLWEKVGLCVHRSPYTIDGIGYVISHFNSGRSMLRHIKSKEQAYECMRRIYDEILPDWTFTEEEWNQYSNEEKHKIKEKIDVLQKEILEGR